MKYFKGDQTEIKVVAAVKPAFDAVSTDLDEMYSGGAVSSAFLLDLFDNALVPYSQRIKRESFVAFYREMLNQYPVTGTFEAYLYILRAVFGSDSLFLFESATPGSLSIVVNVSNELNYDFIGYDGSGEFNIGTQDGIFTLLFRAVSGFESDHDIDLLFSELIPIGIIPTLSINLYDYSNFVALDDATLYDVIDQSGNQIVFYEIGE